MNLNGPTAFRMKSPLAALSGAYPASEDVLQAVALGPRERSVVARLWVSEGIPFAFRECPALYEEARTWLAERLELDAKEVSMGGSGRLGYSLAPARWGNAYNPQSSDLDVFAVSEQLFDGFREDFKHWGDDYDNGAVVPTNEEERKYWPANQREVPGCIDRGFLDSWRVPNRTAYPIFSKTNDCLAGLRAKLRKTAVGPKPQKKLTLRCYRDWLSYERQLSLNLATAASRNRSRAC